MGKSILAVQPLTRNDISMLSQVLEASLVHYSHNTSFFTDYLKALKTLVGLGFTAALVEGRLLNSYRTYLECFLSHGEGDFKANQDAQKRIAQYVAEMVGLSTIHFHLLKYPRYHEDFIHALDYAMAKTLDSP